MSRELRLEARRRERERGLLREREAELTRDLRSLASREDGKRFLRWLLSQGNIFAADYLPGDAGAYQAGKKAAALRLWNLLRELLAPETFAEIALSGTESFAGDSEVGDDWNPEVL